MALQVQKEIVRTEEAFQSVGERSNVFTPRETTSEGTSRAAREADEPIAAVLEVFKFNAALALGGILRGSIGVVPNYPEL
jgi:uncharacterized MAPEG superfamily protein